MRTRSETIFDVEKREQIVAELSEKRVDPDFWNNPEQAREVEKKIAAENEWLESWYELKRKAEDVETLRLLAEEENDESLEGEIRAEAEQLKRLVDALELRSMLSGPDDHRDAILVIHPGAGGTESQDWAEMLLRMYTRWGEKNGFDASSVPGI